MKRVKTILAFLVVISIMVTGLIGYAQPNAIDKIEIVEAFEAGFILLNFTGKEGGEKLEVKVTKKLSIPLIIVINEGTMTFEFGWDDKFSIFTDREIKLDLSRKIEDSIVFPQTGTTRITGGSMSTKHSFGKNTAMVFKKIQYSQDQVIEGIIAALKDEEKNGAVIALGEIGDERAVEPLKEALKDKSKDVQIWAAFSLYKLGDTQKIEFLITVLKDEDGNVRETAAEALNKITGKDFGEDEAKWRDWLGEE
ncbi:MAG: HEAT repeat domain-containing protein [Candidatus Atribacteria bacterium]|nr:MAG: HEAT repeat domain-containing protein [Candidatus Atribacteria bacterium]